MSPETVALAEKIFTDFHQRGLKIATAESCTGGLVAAYLTEIPGSSEVVERGFVTYSNEAKTELLGVDAALIAEKGAVSREVALAMAAGALAHSHAEVSVAITGIAGPGGGSAEKPVGLVHFAVAKAKARLDHGLDYAALHHEERFGDVGRAAVREKSVAVALKLLMRGAELT